MQERHRQPSLGLRQVLEVRAGSSGSSNRLRVVGLQVSTVLLRDRLQLQVLLEGVVHGRLVVGVVGMVGDGCCAVRLLLLPRGLALVVVVKVVHFAATQRHQ